MKTDEKPVAPGPGPRAPGLFMHKEERSWPKCFCLLLTERPYKGIANSWMESSPGKQPLSLRSPSFARRSRFNMGREKPAEKQFWALDQRGPMRSAFRKEEPQFTLGFVLFPTVLSL